MLLIFLVVKAEDNLIPVDECNFTRHTNNKIFFPIGNEDLILLTILIVFIFSLVGNGSDWQHESTGVRNIVNMLFYDIWAYYTQRYLSMSMNIYTQ